MIELNRLSKTYTVSGMTIEAIKLIDIAVKKRFCIPHRPLGKRQVQNLTFLRWERFFASMSDTAFNCRLCIFQKSVAYFIEESVT